MSVLKEKIEITGATMLVKPNTVMPAGWKKIQDITLGSTISISYDEDEDLIKNVIIQGTKDNYMNKKPAVWNTSAISSIAPNLGIEGDSNSKLTIKGELINFVVNSTGGITLELWEYVGI